MSCSLPNACSSPSALRFSPKTVILITLLLSFACPTVSRRMMRRRTPLSLLPVYQANSPSSHKRVCVLLHNPLSPMARTQSSGNGKSANPSTLDPVGRVCSLYGNLSPRSRKPTDWLPSKRRRLSLLKSHLSLTRQTAGRYQRKMKT